MWRFVVKGLGPEEEPLAMPKENESRPLLEKCWHELQRLYQYSVELNDLCATNKRFLTGATRTPLPAATEADPRRPSLLRQSWRQKAEETRELAHRLTVAKAKPRLLEIADAYDQLQD